MLDEVNDKPDLDALDSVFAFAGREWDNDAGLYYNRARWLDPRIGRFLSEDPLGFEGGDSNLYRYANNDPFNLVDPSGMSWLSSFLKKAEKTIKRTFKTIENFVTNIDDVAKGLAKDPLFWVTTAAWFAGIPLPGANVTWGAFEYGVGLGGFGFNTSWLKLGTETFSFLSGQGFNLGLPTLNWSTTLASGQWSPFATATQYVYAAQNGSSAVAEGRQADGNIMQAQYVEDGISPDQYQAMESYVEENGLPWTPRAISAEDQKMWDSISSWTGSTSKSTNSVDWGALWEPIVDDASDLASAVSSAPGKAWNWLWTGKQDATPDALQYAQESGGQKLGGWIGGWTAGVGTGPLFQTGPIGPGFSASGDYHFGVDENFMFTWGPTLTLSGGGGVGYAATWDFPHFTFTTAPTVATLGGFGEEVAISTTLEYGVGGSYSWTDSYGGLTIGPSFGGGLSGSYFKSYTWLVFPNSPSHNFGEPYNAPQTHTGDVTLEPHTSGGSWDGHGNRYNQGP